MTDFIKDIIDLSSVRSLMESLYQATGTPVSILDHEGQVLVTAGGPDACASIHRKCPKTAKHCRESDLFFSRFMRGNKLPDSGFIKNTCKNGLIEIGVPIVINNSQIATLLFGRFLPEPVDYNFFKKVAGECGIDEQEYLKAILQVPVYDQRLVNKLFAVYSGIVELLTKLGQTHLEETSARQKLKRSEEKFRDLFNSSSDAIYIVNMEGMILEVNEVACTRQGYDSDELLSMRISDLEDPSFSSSIKERLSRFKNGESIIFETAHLHKDGTSIPVEISGRVLTFEGTEVIMASARDLRERHDALQALQRSESKFRSIIDSSPMGVLLYYLDPQDRLLFTGANAAAEKILGINNSALIGKTIEEAFPGLAETDIPEHYRRICNTGGTWNSEQIDYEDEKIKGAFEAYAFQTTPKTMAVFFLEITERKTAEQALRESEEKYRMLFSAEKDAILILDSAQLNIVETNYAASKMYGYSPEEFSKLYALDLSAEPKQSQQRINDVINESLDMMESRHKKKDGTVFPVEITAGTFEWQNKYMLVAIVRDISERERINHMKDEMLSSISHEMRTPLTAILGFTELLLQEDIDAEKSKQFLRLSYQEGERLRELIDDLLDLQRLRAGFSGNQFTMVNIKAMLQEIASIFADMTEEHEITISCPDGCPEIFADEQKIHRALKNLMTNAVKYSPGGGPVSLSAKLLKKKKMVAISIQDQGLGIPKEAQSELFDRFFRVYHPELKNIGGTGLGLALVKEIINLHEGHIHVKSAPGKGSTFTIELPISGLQETPYSDSQD
jgi:PAS domain S-box-containing protein